ncbi:hypothetical protein BV20DRAFT_44030 [Pilatotrama ljubarskyi]|nr:hypothetical protein BV20DRAFT_44030 [Pilatotrama ljubarskyi]
MADSEHDPAFAALPLSLQQRIDDAFDAALNGTHHTAGEPARKRRKLDHSPAPGGFVARGFIPEAPAAGGFIVDEPTPVREESPAAGGFFAEDDTSEAVERQTHIPLSLIPTALQVLDLQPDDEDVLSVFRNAASGWGSNTRGRSGENEEEDALVSRKDWRAVCAALLDTGGPDDDEDLDMGDEGAGDREATEEAVEEAFSDSGEEYVQSGGSESEAEDDDSSDDDYQDGGGFVRSKKAKGSGAKTGGSTARRMSRQAASPKGSEEGEGHGLSARQKKECRAAFALFFPDVPEGELDKQRIRIKDISRVAKLLKEKITAEETVEMLEAFSSVPDKSMGLSDFERMMTAARLA